ncbi:MAG: CofC family guanylyltransferase [Methanimicrococcus sp.]|nr:CofC family guanylyltransferase [Methanimicrococcus sp.]
MKTVIPYKSDNPKSRLSAVFSEEERKQFVELSLENVLSALRDAGIRRVDILCKSLPAPADEQRIRNMFCHEEAEMTFSADERDLNAAMNDYLKRAGEPVLIVMADLALLTKENVSAMIASPSAVSVSAVSVSAVSPSAVSPSAGFVRIAPGKDGGTNMMYIGAPDIFEVNYYGESFKKHREEARNKNLVCEVYASLFAAADMDEPEDLTDILLYGKGKLQEFVSAAMKKRRDDVISHI